MDDKSLEEDLSDMISDVSTDSIHESPNNAMKNVPKIQFSKHPKNVRDYAAKIRKIERKIMLGLLTDTEESKLRSSKYFSKRFEKLLNLSNNTKKTNLYKMVTNITLNQQMIDDLQKKKTSPNIRKKIQTKVHNLGLREKSVQEKVNAGTLSQNDVDSFLRDMYFTVKFGEHLSLDHPQTYQNDPEEGNLHQQQSDELLCDYCQSTNEKNRYGQQEDLLICKDCSNKAHPSCLNYSPELVEQIRSDGSWQCIDCKACSICDGTGDPDTLLFCDACDKGYHMQCHTPKLEQTPSGKWACATCVSKGKHVSSSSTKQVLVIDDDSTDDITQLIKSSRPPVAPVAPMAPQISNSSNVAVGTMVTVTTLPVVTPMEVMPIVSAPRRALDSTSGHANPQKAPAHITPVMSVKQSTNVVYHPSALTYTHLPAGSTAVPLAPGHHPVSMQHQFIPVNYMLPNGATAAAQIPQHIPVQHPSAHPSRPIPQMQAGVQAAQAIPLSQSQQVIPISAQQAQTVLGKGSHNELTHILNPKLPLPDVRSEINKDVLASLPHDVADWSVQNVVYYFKSHGYIHESKLLEEQEIDGRAMLLMSRNDCLTGLRIKLGPALKIYYMHIHKLQKRTEFLG